MKSICDLLDSDLMNRAKDEKLSVSQLGGLFSYVDSGDDIARRNAELLSSANSKIVIDFKQLRKYAKDPFSQSSATDTVRVQIEDNRYPHDNNTDDLRKFRLAGGQACSRVVGNSEIDSLFVEMRIQLSAKSENDDIVELNSSVNEVYTRVRKVFELAHHIFRVLALGWDFEKGECIKLIEYKGESDSLECVIEFPSQAPRSLRIRQFAEFDPVHDIMEVWNMTSTHDSLIDNLITAKRSFPFVSFASPLHVMQRKVCTSIHRKAFVVSCACLMLLCALAGYPVDQNTGWHCIKHQKQARGWTHRGGTSRAESCYFLAIG